MSDSNPTVDKVLELMNNMVAKDGGVITLDAFDPDAGTMAVDYRMGINEECATCSITPELVQVFLAESLDSHGVPNVDVVVKSVA
jgi:Fe-S cluster biogenesis protein NfuA